jgi:phenylalanyl-tRNA synthetase alpha chain
MAISNPSNSSHHSRSSNPCLQLVSLSAYREAVGLRDLSDPAQGPHALQLLVRAAVEALRAARRVPCLVWRANPVIPIEDNYDKLGYPPDGVARDARYTRYVSERLLLRTQTSAVVRKLCGD